MSEAVSVPSTDVAQANSSIALIESVNTKQMANQLQAIQNFQAMVQSQLKDGQDYGVIPGTGSKATLLKPGAEKILMIMGVQSQYEVVDKVENYDPDDPYFDYTIKCTLSHNGTLLTEGLGNGNTREKKNQRKKDGKPDPTAAFDVKNTVLKMAKKRAQIDATLTIASLSNIFTQDLEDTSDNSFNERAEAATMTYEEALKVKSPIKKDNGKTLGEIAKTNMGTIEFLAEKSYSKQAKAAAKLILNHKDEKPADSQNKPQEQASAKPNYVSQKIKLIATYSKKIAKIQGVSAGKPANDQLAKHIDGWKGINADWAKLDDATATLVANELQKASEALELERASSHDESAKQAAAPKGDPFKDDA